MAHTTLASTDRALEKIGEFVALLRTARWTTTKSLGRPETRTKRYICVRRRGAVAVRPRAATCLCAICTTTSGTRRDFARILAAAA